MPKAGHITWCCLAPAPRVCNMSQFLSALGAYTLSNHIEIRSATFYHSMLGRSLLISYFDLIGCKLGRSYVFNESRFVFLFHSFAVLFWHAKPWQVCQSMKYFFSLSLKLGMLSIFKNHLGFVAFPVFPGMSHNFMLHIFGHVWQISVVDLT